MEFHYLMPVLLILEKLSCIRTFSELNWFIACESGFCAFLMKWFTLECDVWSHVLFIVEGFITVYGSRNYFLFSVVVFDGEYQAHSAREGKVCQVIYYDDN